MTTETLGDRDNLGYQRDLKIFERLFLLRVATEEMLLGLRDTSIPRNELHDYKDTLDIHIHLAIERDIPWKHKRKILEGTQVLRDAIEYLREQKPEE